MTVIIGDDNGDDEIGDAEVGSHHYHHDYLHADATQPATGHLALPVLSLPFPVSPMSRC